MAKRVTSWTRIVTRIWLCLIAVCILLSILLHTLVTRRLSETGYAHGIIVNDFEPCDTRAEYNLTDCDVECQRRRELWQTVDCACVLLGDFNAHREAQRHVEEFSSFDISDEAMAAKTRNCTQYTSNTYYPSKALSAIEEAFPIGYTLVAHKDGLQLEKLLQAIYWPQNWYCIHLDLTAGRALHEFIANLVKCLPHVIVPNKRDRVIYGGISRLKADIHCMKELLRRGSTWKYVINLTGQEYPLKTNREIVEILKSYNGSNDIEKLPNSAMPTFEARYRYHWKLKEHKRLIRTHTLKAPPPGNLTLVKGSAFGLFSRVFLEFVVSDNRVAQFLAWLDDTWSPDEVFWSTLDANFRGSWTPRDGRHGDGGTWRAKYAVWPDSQECHGLKVHWSCVFSFRDLPAMVRSNQLFANKFDVHFDYVALGCLEQWLHNKTYHIDAT